MKKKLLLLCVIYTVTSFWWGPAVEAAFRLERVDGSRPTKGMKALGVMGHDLEFTGWTGSISTLLPKPAKPRVESPRPVTTVTGSGIWDRLAQCESGGNWGTNTGNGYHGGLQFSPSTWRAAGGTKYAPYAYQATREQQIEIAQAWLARTSWGQWPACSRKLGLR